MGITRGVQGINKEISNLTVGNSGINKNIQGMVRGVDGTNKEIISSGFIFSEKGTIVPPYDFNIDGNSGYYQYKKDTVNGYLMIKSWVTSDGGQCYCNYITLPQMDLTKYSKVIVDCEGLGSNYVARQFHVVKEYSTINQVNIPSGRNIIELPLVNNNKAKMKVIIAGNGNYNEWGEVRIYSIKFK